jgi:Fur family ferric uptake transcriptional regulator
MPDLTSDTELERALHTAGLKSTRPRMLVLRFLREHAGHHSADAITDALTARDTSLLRGSVYHILNKLQRHGVIMLADVGPGRALYESGPAWHHHFVCRECEAVLDVACATGHNPCLEAGIRGAEVDEAQVIYRGRCPTCVSSSAS